MEYKHHRQCALLLYIYKISIWETPDSLQMQPMYLRIVNVCVHICVLFTPRFYQKRIPHLLHVTKRNRKYCQRHNGHKYATNFAAWIHVVHEIWIYNIWCSPSNNMFSIETCFLRKMQKNWGLWQNRFSTCCRHVTI